jgi:hypothetical protein
MNRTPCSPSGDRDGFVSPKLRLVNTQFLFMYPSATLNCYSKGWYLIRISPLSSDRTNIECEYYKHKAATLAEMEEFLAFGKQVQKEVRSYYISIINGGILIFANNCNPT